MKNYKNIMLMSLALVLMACGESKKEENEQITISDNASTSSSVEVDDSKEADEEMEEEESANDGEVVEISLSANDQMKFSKNEIKVKAGSTVKLTFTHTGEMSDKVMGHNFVLLNQGTDISTFGQNAIKAMENDYIPNNGEQVIAHTEIIGGGEATTIEFEVPAKGTYDFICSFPGHYALMQGKFIVE